MAEEPYLLTLTEREGEHEFTTHHLIEAEDRQMVKYHFHRTLKDWSYRDTQWDKHCLQSGRLMAEISQIRSLQPEEYDILDRFMYHWTKV